VRNLHHKLSLITPLILYSAGYQVR